MDAVRAPFHGRHVNLHDGMHNVYRLYHAFTKPGSLCAREATYTLIV